MKYSTHRSLSGELPCKEQHAAYQLERARVSKLAAELGPVAANCHRLHGDYDSAAAAASVQSQENARCATSLTTWTARKSAYDAYLLKKAGCDSKEKAIDDYKKLVIQITTENAKKKSNWESTVADLSSKNLAISRIRLDKLQEYRHQLAVWEDKNKAWKQWQESLNGRAYGYSYGFSMRMNGPGASDYNRTTYNMYDWKYRTNQCGKPMQCMTQAIKDATASQCVVLRGLEGFGSLGATSKTTAPICKVRLFYPTCHTSACPPTAPNPGAKPTEPTLPTLHVLPKEPTYAAIPTLEEYLISKRVPQGPCPATSVPNPGSKPTCNPNTPIPPVPPQPTCIAPNIPSMPVAPSCKEGLLSQVGPMWLLLAAGGVGLYWYSKKK